MRFLEDVFWKEIGFIAAPKLYCKNILGLVLSLLACYVAPMEALVERTVRDGSQRSFKTYSDRYEPDVSAIRTNSYSVSCYSCMSSYFQAQWEFIAHMYASPAGFTDSCNFESLDVTRLQVKNCTDMCIWLRMEDRIGGRIRYGYLRGCMSDVRNYNHTTVRFLTYRTKCTYVKFQDIFQPRGRLRLQKERVRYALCLPFESLQRGCVLHK